MDDSDAVPVFTRTADADEFVEEKEVEPSFAIALSFDAADDDGVDVARELEDDEVAESPAAGFGTNIEPG